MLVINFFAGAGAGKSTVAAEVFSKLKKAGYNAELVGEYAKEAILQQDVMVLKDQLFLFAQQLHRLRCYTWSNVDIAICDCPLPFALIYNQYETKDFEKLVWSEFNRFQNLNYFIERMNGFWKAAGRVGDEETAKANDAKIKELLQSMDYTTISPLDADRVVSDVKKMLKSK